MAIAESEVFEWKFHHGHSRHVASYIFHLTTVKDGLLGGTLIGQIWTLLNDAISSLSCSKRCFSGGSIDRLNLDIVN